jgi:RNA methyltransferase, TrmH family
MGCTKDKYAHQSNGSTRGPKESRTATARRLSPGARINRTNLLGERKRQLIRKRSGGVGPFLDPSQRLYELAYDQENLLRSRVMAALANAAGSPRSPGGGPATITSRDNRWLKEFRMALRGGLPTESGGVGAEGVRLVEEALRSGCPVRAVLFSESGERHRQRLAPLIDRLETALPILHTTDRLFEGIADTEHPQGVAALVQPRIATFDDLLRTPGEACSPLLVVLVGVQDPGNVGTILRTASAFGATGAVTAASGQSGTASPFSPKALRASAGAALHLPVLSGMSLAILLTQLRMAGVRTLASVAHKDHSVAGPGHAAPELDKASGSGRGLVFAPWEVDWCEPVALLVGNEGAGLPEDVARSADASIRIPMASGTESLNAAAAAAVLFYEAARQRKSLAPSSGPKP